jgi:uncharacterized protein (TIGR03545 family)
MKQWIRWQGLGAFVGMMVMVCALWLLFVDSFVKRTIENVGTRIVEAQVEVDEVDISLFPIGFTLTRLQVTDPDAPMTNAVEVRDIAFSMDSVNALRRKIIIEEMTMDGLQFGTPRSSSGAISDRAGEKLTGEKKQEAEKIEKFEIPVFEVPDVKKILEKEDLESVKLITSLHSDIARAKEDWRTRLDNLPDKEKLAEYKQRIEALKAARKGGVAGIFGAVAETEAIRKDLEKDLKHIREAQQDFDATHASLKTRFKQLAQAPVEDARRLKNKYSLSPKGLANMTQMLMGPKIRRWVERGLTWYEKLQPILQRTMEKKNRERGPDIVKPMRRSGVDVRFREYGPLPDFLIRRLKANLQIQTGDLTGSVKNITPDQDILGTPLLFLISGEELKGLQAVKLDGILNHVIPAKPSDAVHLHVQEYEARDLTLSDNPQLAVAMDKGLVDLDLRGTLRGEVLAATVTSGLKSAKISVRTEEAANPVVKAMETALTKVSALSLKVDITGTLDAYDMHVTSDLDRLLRDAAGTIVQEQQARLERELSAAISDKIGGQLAGIEDGMRGLDAIAQELANRLTH